MKSHKKCPKCGRLLVPNDRNKWPRHRAPLEDPNTRNASYGVSLTGLDSPWCKWEGKWAL